MADKLKLLDTSVPLLDRYDIYLEWESQNSTISLQVVSQNLEIGIAYVEVFIDLGKLDVEEFKIIDEKKIDMDSLVLILKENKEDRKHIYENFLSIISNTSEPVKSLRNFIGGDNEPLFREKLINISPEAYFRISQYLKQTGIINGTITKSFRGFLVTIGKKIQNEEFISDKQFDWLVKAISHSNVHSLDIFTNEIIRVDFPEDYNIFRQIIDLIEKTH